MKSSIRFLTPPPPSYLMQWTCNSLNLEQRPISFLGGRWLGLRKVRERVRKRALHVLDRERERDVRQCNSVYHTNCKNSQEGKHFQVSMLVTITGRGTSGFLSSGNYRSVHKLVSNSKVIVTVVLETLHTLNAVIISGNAKKMDRAVWCKSRNERKVERQRERCKGLRRLFTDVSKYQGRIYIHTFCTIIQIFFHSESTLQHVH